MSDDANEAPEWLQQSRDAVAAEREASPWLRAQVSDDNRSDWGKLADELIFRPLTIEIGVSDRRVVDVHLPRPYDSDGDLNCGRPGCLYCGRGERFSQPLERLSCPSCGRQTLMATDRGRVLCSSDSCGCQAALQQLLTPDALTEGQHRVTLSPIGHWTAVHPMIERIGDRLIHCGIEGVARNMIRRPPWTPTQQLPS